MVLGRPRTKAKTVAPRTGLKIKLKIPKTSAASDEDLSEAALRRLPRSELQKLAKAHKVKANMKSELIIQQLSSLQIPKKIRPAENDLEEGPSRKRLKREAVSEEVPALPPAAPQDAQPSQDTSAQPSAKDPPPPDAGSLAPRSMSPARKAPVVASYDKDLFSGTESEMTEEEQLDFATPVSSRSETPPPANVNDLKRCVTIMQQISAQDVALLDNVTGIRETAVKLRKRARDVRDLVKAESGRRERMEAYFRYWQEIEPTWDRKWLYGEKMTSDHKARLDFNRSAGPSTIPSDQGAQRPAAPVPGQKPVLSPEELKRKREAIIQKQKAEQRQLKALRGMQMRGEISSREGSSEEDDGRGLSGADLPSAEKNDVERLFDAAPAPESESA
ncbi:hypothetical protein JVT61DRAFT_561 [Boletus reticuloceps]|uniref:Uncharacterized protein n=1 Tax=Boletus reticuloceps TaxID=495285 RepID=A0A8I2Z3L0_9AGAM|nr:hypothetical protein JVT61DRAFT_561 [Boletus reticuloceps]